MPRRSNSSKKPAQAVPSQEWCLPAFHIVNPTHIPNPFSPSSSFTHSSSNPSTYSMMSTRHSMLQDNEAYSMVSTSSCSASSSSSYTCVHASSSSNNKRKVSPSSSSKKKKKNSSSNNNCDDGNNISTSSNQTTAHTFINNKSSTTTRSRCSRSNKDNHASSPLKQYLPTWQSVMHFVQNHIKTSHCDQKEFLRQIRRTFGIDLKNDQVFRHHLNRMGILNHQHALLIQTEEDLVPTLDHKWLDEPKLLQQLLKTKDGKETILSYPYIACMFRSTPSQVKKKVKPLLDELGIEMPVFDFNKNRIRDYFSTYLQVDGFTTNNNSNQDHSQFIENSDENNSTSDDIASQHHGADVSPNMSSFSHANNDEEQEMSSFIPSFENGPLTNLDDTSPHTTRQPPIMSFTPQSPSNIQLTIGNNFEFLSSWTNPPTFVSLEQDALHNTLWGEDFLSSMHSSSNQQQLPFLYCSNSSGNNMESPQNPPFVVGVNPNTPHVVGEELFDFSFMNSNEDIFSLNFQ